MIFIDSISDLAYYHTPAGSPCFCESVSLASDVYLQSILSAGAGSFSTVIYVYSSDGLTNLETATAYFTVTYGVTPDSQQFFEARLNTFSPAMCQYKCFILRVVVTATGAGVVFDKYTEVYCQTTCCQTATSVSFSQDGVTGFSTTPTLTPIEQTDDCGNKIIRLISSFTCYDNFRNQSYVDGFLKISNFKGRLVQRPAELTREISYNCRVQRSERAKIWLLEGYEYFPSWKMSEIQDQLLAETIQVDDGNEIKTLQFIGGTPFTKVKGARECDEIFKLFVLLQECTVRQVFGCAIPCAELTSYFVIPQAYGEGSFYSDNGDLIATNYDELLQWFGSQDGVTSVEDVDTSGLDCTVYAIAGVQGTGFLPTSVYFDAVITRNRIFAIPQETLDGICGAVGQTPCVKPVAGASVIIEVDCATPVAGSTVIIEITADEVAINNYGAWDNNNAETEALLYQNQITMMIKSINATQYVVPSGELITIVNAIVGTIEIAGAPQSPRTLNSSNTGSLTGDQTFTIDTQGFIYFSGTVTASDTDEVTVDFDGLVYNVNNLGTP